MPGIGVIPGFIDSAITAHDPVVGILRIDPHAVIVHVFPFFAGSLKGLTTILGVVQPGIHAEYFVDIMGIANDFLVIVPRSFVAASFGPIQSLIGGAVESVFVVLGVNDGIDAVAICRRDR